MSTPEGNAAENSATAVVEELLPVPGGLLPVQLYLPEAGSGPGIVLVQEIFGVSHYIVARARALAALGYVVAVPELYWRIGITATAEEGDSMLDDAMAASKKLGLEPAIADTVATVTWLPQRPEVTGKVGLLGFCFGGGVAFAAAAQTDPAVLVSYYGSSIPAHLDLAERVTVPSLHHWGQDDAFIPSQVQAQIHQALARPGVEWHTYPGANHAFDNPNPMFHDEAASQLAWQRTTAFLARYLKA